MSVYVEARAYFRCTNCTALSAEVNKGCCVSGPAVREHTFEPVTLEIYRAPKPGECIGCVGFQHRDDCPKWVMCL